MTGLVQERATKKRKTKRKSKRKETTKTHENRKKLAETLSTNEILEKRKKSQKARTAEKDTLGAKKQCKKIFSDRIPHS